MHPTAGQFLMNNGEAQIAAAYNEAGYRYSKYADGGGRELFAFEGRHAYGDRKTWEVMRAKLLTLRAQGNRQLRVVDLGCGPGIWLCRVVMRARQLGFEEITAWGFDIAEAQLTRARALSRGLAALPGVTISFGHGDLRGPIAASDCDLALCLHGVLNHIPPAELPPLLERISAATSGYFIASVRAIGSTPTVYVDDVASALRFYQDNHRDRLDVEFANGRRASFQSHLFSHGELLRLASAAFEVEGIRGVDLFHSRFAGDARWNPEGAAPLMRLTQELTRLEDQYCRDPGFVNHATQLLLEARSRDMAVRS